MAMLIYHHRCPSAGVRRVWMRALLFGSLLLTVFLIGWVASNLYLGYANFAAVEAPFSFRTLFSSTGPEVRSPADHITEDAIKVYDDHIVLDLAGASWASYADTNSMDPVFDDTANGIEVQPTNTADIHVGDVISYRTRFTDGLVVHRVVGTGSDSKGWYALTKGDNNPTADPQKVRFADIHGVLVGIIY